MCVCKEQHIDGPELPDKSLQDDSGLQSEMVPGVFPPAQDGGYLGRFGGWKWHGRKGGWVEVGSEVEEKDKIVPGPQREVPTPLLTKHRW